MPSHVTVPAPPTLRTPSSRRAQKKSLASSFPAGIASGAAVGTAKPAMPRSTSQYMSLTLPASQSAVFRNAARSSSVVMRRYSFRPTV